MASQLVFLCPGCGTRFSAQSMDHEQQLATGSGSILVDVYTTICSGGCDGRFLQWTVEDGDIDLLTNNVVES